MCGEIFLYCWCVLALSCGVSLAFLENLCGCCLPHLRCSSVHPVLHTIRVGIWVGPVTALLVVCNTITILLYLPYLFLNALYTTLVTGYIGPNLKLITLLLLPTIVALAPVVTVIGSVVFGIGCTVIMAWSNGCDKNCTGHGAFAFAAASVADFWNLCWYSTNGILCGYRTSADGPHDIPLLLLPFALLSGVAGILFCGIGVTVIALLKFLPVFCRGYVWMCDWFDRAGDLAKICCPLVLVAALLWPVFAVAGLALVIAWGFLVGAWTPVMYYVEGRGFLAALWWSYKVVRDFDVSTNRWAFGASSRSSCLPDPDSFGRRSESGSTQPPPPHQQPLQGYQNDVAADGSGPAVAVQVEPTAPPAGFTPVLASTPVEAQNTVTPLNVNAIWDSFFAACAIHTQQALVEGLVAREEIADQEPFLYIGIPGLTIFRGFIRSMEAGSSGVLLATGIELNETNRPRVPLSQMMFQPIMDAKRVIVDIAPTPAEIRYMERTLVRGDAVESAVNPSQDGISGDRLIVLHRGVAAVASLATTVSRLPQFHRRFTTVLNHATGADSRV